jgi:hypothetical protein
MNLTGLGIYLLVTSYITVYVGQILYKNGRHFLIAMLVNEALTDYVNRILLVGYYLLNLGYVAVMLSQIRPANSLNDLIPIISSAIGRILITLGVMHCINITTIIIWSKLNTTKNHTYEH